MYTEVGYATLANPANELKPTSSLTLTITVLVLAPISFIRALSQMASVLYYTGLDP
ncbi:hypothetical protein B0H14DRAFT_3458420 [Mycena olivaceomarginata]|nr:hypothetical protein B0H14DRAFT_3458420 [Mycena olivaceomarginata]